MKQIQYLLITEWAPILKPIKGQRSSTCEHNIALARMDIASGGPSSALTFALPLAASWWMLSQQNLIRGTNHIELKCHQKRKIWDLNKCFNILRSVKTYPIVTFLHDEKCGKIKTFWFNLFYFVFYLISREDFWNVNNLYVFTFYLP